MIRSELIDRLAAEHKDLNPREVEAIVATFFDCIIQRLVGSPGTELEFAL